MVCLLRSVMYRCSADVISVTLGWIDLLYSLTALPETQGRITLDDLMIT